MDADELLQAVIDSPTQHGIVVTDPDGRIQLWNTGAARIFQYREEEVLGRDARSLFSDDDVARDIPGQEMATALRDGCAGDFRWHARKDGSLFWADGMIYPVRSRSGTHLGFVKVLRDATHQKHSGDATSRQAMEDNLTGLPNRAAFRHRFIDMAASAQRHGQLLVMLLLDLDGFKPVNDEFGHPAGDAVLQQVACRMRTAMRDTDFVARLGGDEFVVLLPDATSVAAGGAAANKLIKSLARPFRVANRAVQVGASIGLGVYPQDGNEFDALFRKADLALYRAKSEGRGIYRFYTGKMDETAHRRNLEQSQLRRAVKDREFTLSYLPQVDATGRILAVEALLRCSSPFFAGYPGERIVALAAETGRLRRLGLWAATEAARQLRRWHLEGHPDLHLILNFTPVEFTAPRFVQRLQDLAMRMELEPSHLEIDIAEPTLGQNFSPAAIVQLHEYGVSITIDDFGSGGISLKHLFELPIGAIKLDVRMFPDLTAEPRRRAAARAIAEFCHNLDIRVIAEHVETQAQADFIRPLCDAIQGFHIAVPMTADETSTWLAMQASPNLASRVTRRLGQAFGRPSPTRDADRTSRH